MSLFGPSRNRAARQAPTIPSGQKVATFSSYAQAHSAVNYLSAQKFPIEKLTIIGTDVHLVERVTGRLSYSRVAIAGATTGSWFGLFVGVLFSVFGSEGGERWPTILTAVAFGTAIGILFSVVSFALSSGKHAFTSTNQAVATTYTVMCEDHLAQQAIQQLREGGLTTVPAPVVKTQEPVTTVPPTGLTYGEAIDRQRARTTPGTTTAPQREPQQHTTPQQGEPNSEHTNTVPSVSPNTSAGNSQPDDPTAP